MIALSALSIRNLDDRVKERLRVRAARHGRSMEAEVRAILADAVATARRALRSAELPAGGTLCAHTHPRLIRIHGPRPRALQAIMDRFGELGGVELDLPPRSTRPRAAEFGS